MEQIEELMEQREPSQPCMGTTELQQNSVFRQMRRKGQELSVEENISILRKATAGTLALLGDNGYPYTVPISYVYADGKLYFHSALNGHKIDAIRNYDKASFCVYDKGVLKEGDWGLWFKSVIVFGHIEIIEDRDRIYDIARKLSHKFTNDEQYIEDEIRRSGPRTEMFVLVPEHISGKLVHES